MTKRQPGVMYHGISHEGNWDVDTREGLTRAVEWMERHVSIFKDQGRWVIPRSMSIVVIDKTNRRAIRVAGLAPETSTKKVFEAMGWKWIDQASGEKVDG